MRHTVNVQVNSQTPRPQRVFYALASLPRRRIIAFLSQTALSTADLAERFAMSRPAISRHLSVLVRAGRLSAKRSARSAVDSAVCDRKAMMRRRGSEASA